MNGDLLSALDTLRSCRLLVVGDVMLDRYVRGEAERISPEAPVIVLRADDEEVRLGGAGGVASFARALGADVSLAGVVGSDAAAVTLRCLCRDDGIDTSRVLVDASRPTTQKERFIGLAAGRHAHQMLRVDRESRSPLEAGLETELIHLVTSAIAGCEAVLIADYAKGVCTRELVAAVVRAARECDPPRPVLVDPGRGRPADWYRGATLLKPNRHEGSQLTGVALHDIDSACAAAHQIQAAAEVEHVVLTLDRDGCVVASCEATTFPVSADARAVYDITGAGDMFLAMLGLSFGNGLSLEVAVRLANAAAGLEVERAGSAPVTLAELRQSLAGQVAHPNKLTTLAALVPCVAEYRRQSRRVVFTNGCFDLLHVGHVSLLEEAAQLGDVLIVAINSDASVRKLKGTARPLIAEHARARMLAALECVDHVLIFDDATPHRLLHALKPDVLVKGGTTPDIIGREVVEAYGGQVRRTSEVPGLSTTRLVQQLRSDRPLAEAVS